ncbi:T9SS type A sorting domain-containing protein [Halpernia frigidisoli]|uniref:Por secretion system C-terminal sorting domain-containing protein n=1 Tax=Halpernia frigidisoli TaxID=1125876 RepID=A0A1I3E0P0_9FLAO|nr:T9SS type A sorting domain-containing protein [Halpernia frigidisoli]SFH92515.1 Por secretion system C-terminal sorting domain-containing protein [Halpernia frigidisoli]
MKKILLSLFATTALAFTVNAQTTKYSFETAEGFTLGDVLGQNPKIDTYYDDGTTTYTSETNIAEVTNERANDGVNSLKIMDYSDATIGGIYVTGIPVYQKTSISYDLFVPALDGSDNLFFLYDNVGTATIIDLDYQGNVRIYDPISNAFSTIGTFSAARWAKVEVQVDFAAVTLKVFLNGTSIFSGPYHGSGNTLTETDFAIDNFGTDAFFDNIQIRNLGALATNEVINSKNNLRISPNPAVDFVKITTEGKIENAQIFDASGKLVKSSKNTSELLNVEDLKKGIYILKVKTDKGEYSTKLMKK